MLWESDEPEAWCSVDLNDLLSARQGLRWTLASAEDINDSGLIVGQALFDAQMEGEAFPRERGFLLTCAADPDGNGIIDGADLGIVNANWPCEEPTSSSLACPGDVNFDGTVDGADAGLVLAGWGVCSLRQLCEGSSSFAMMGESGASASELLGSPVSLVLAGLGFASIDEFVVWLNGASAEQRSATITTIQTVLLTP